MIDYISSIPEKCGPGGDRDGDNWDAVIKTFTKQTETLLSK